MGCAFLACGMNGCFACGTGSCNILHSSLTLTDNGFRIYNVDPFRETFRRVFSNGGIGIVEMLFRYVDNFATSHLIPQV